MHVCACVCMRVHVCIHSLIIYNTFPQSLDVNLTHIESRPSITSPGKEYDFYIDCECEADVKDEFLRQLKTVSLSLRVMARTPSEDEGEWRGEEGRRGGGREGEGEGSGEGKEGGREEGKRGREEREREAERRSEGVGEKK